MFAGFKPHFFSAKLVSVFRAGAVFDGLDCDEWQRPETNPPALIAASAAADLNGGAR